MLAHERLNILDYPIIATEPSRIESSGWLMHIPFAMFIAELVRPNVFVELGVYSGVSYCAFCQAALQLELDAHFYGVDTWKGDDQAGYYGEDVLEDLRQHHDDLYEHFSTLMQMTFDEALDHFEDGSVDLLHIDGHHAYEDVRHDFENWQPKLSPRGIAIFHDINTRADGFGVWRYWDELKTQYPYFELFHGYGLGILAFNTPPDRTKALFELSKLEANHLRTIFEQMGKYTALLETRAELETHLKQLEIQLQQTEQRIETMRDDHDAKHRAQEEQLRHLFKQEQEAREGQLRHEFEQTQAVRERRLRQELEQAHQSKFQEWFPAIKREIRGELIKHYQALVDQLQQQHDAHLAQLTQTYTQQPITSGSDQSENEFIRQTRGWRILQRWYVLQLHLLPAWSRRERFYHLVTASIELLLLDGLRAFFQRLYLWTIKGERRYHKRFGDTDRPVSQDTQIHVTDVDRTRRPSQFITANMPALPNRTTPQLPKQVYRQLADTVASILTSYEHHVSILNCHPALDLDAVFPSHAVFSPPMTWDELPYLDDTADIVVTSAHHPIDEAHRVASMAVISIDGDLSPQVEYLRQSSRMTKTLLGASLILPVFNHLDHTEDCLRQILETLPDNLDVEIIVVDDCSTNANTWQELRVWAQRDARIKVVQTSENMGYLMACNRGAYEAEKDIIVTLNNDTLPQSGWIEALLQTFIVYPDAGVVGGKLVFPDGNLQEAGAQIFSNGHAWNVGRFDHPNLPYYNFVREVDYVSGALLATWRHLWEQIGGYDERYRPMYYEDADYCFAVKGRGYKIYYQPKCEIIHVEGVTGGDSRDQDSLKSRSMRQNAKHFNRKWESVIKYQAPARANNREMLAARSLALQRKNSQRRVLIVSPLMPEFDREAGSRRVYHMIELFREMGWSVDLLIENISGSQRYVHIMQQRGVAVFSGRDFHHPEELLAAGQFDLIVAIFWHIGEHMAAAVRNVLPDATFLIDSIDLHFLRGSREVFHDTNSKLSDTFADIVKRELNAYAAADGVLTVSLKEKALVNDLLNRKGAHFYPLFEELEVSPVPFDKRRGILFVGNFRHPPNVQAFNFLMQDILPHIPRHVLQEHLLYVVGNDMQRFITMPSNNQYPQVRFVGWVPSVTPYFEQARISIVPLQVGAGTKRKLLQALMIGTPTVSTSIGVEGLDLEDGRHVVIADEPEPFADAIQDLLYDSRLWHDLHNNGRDHILKSHGKQAARRYLETILNELGLDPAVDTR